MSCVFLHCFYEFRRVWCPDGFFRQLEAGTERLRPLRQTGKTIQAAKIAE